MTQDSPSFFEQVRRNLVALISLVVAISSLAYNTWRNEQSEANRNVRGAGFQLMQELSGLQQVVLLAYYDMDKVGGNPRVGWTHVIAIRDLAYPMPENVQSASNDLFQVWQEDWENIRDSDKSVDRVNAALDRAKLEVLDAIKALD